MTASVCRLKGGGGAGSAPSKSATAHNIVKNGLIAVCMYAYLEYINCRETPSATSFIEEQISSRDVYATHTFSRALRRQSLRLSLLSLLVAVMAVVECNNVRKLSVAELRPTGAVREKVHNSIQHNE